MPSADDQPVRSQPVAPGAAHSPLPAPAAGGSDEARWIAALYTELRALAQSELKSERANHTLSATALVSEVYLKFARAQNKPDGLLPGSGAPIDRGAFFGMAAAAMRRILVDHARNRLRQKRGGGQRPETGEALANIAKIDNVLKVDALALDDALNRLAVEHAVPARVVELRFFAGLPEKTIAEVLEMNERTVRRHWTFAKAWLAREMSREGSKSEQ